MAVIVSPPPVGVAHEGSHRCPCWSTTTLSITRRTACGSIWTFERPAASSASRPPSPARWRSWLPGTSVTRAATESASSASSATGLFSRMARMMAGSGRGCLSSMGTSSARPNAVSPLCGGCAAVRSKMSPSRTSSFSGLRAIPAQRSAKRRPCSGSRNIDASVLSPRCRSLTTNRAIAPSVSSRAPAFLFQERGLFARHLWRERAVVTGDTPPGDVVKGMQCCDHRPGAARLAGPQRHLTIRKCRPARDALHDPRHRSLERRQRATQLPRRTAPNPSRLEARTYASAPAGRPSCTRRIVSYPKVENVV